MPHLRARETSLRGQIDALDAQLADRDAYLKLADDLEGFLAQLHGNAATATVEERQRVHGSNWGDHRRVTVTTSKGNLVSNRNFRVLH